MLLRKIIFWVHLVCGLVAGSVIAIMSFTGAVLAFESEIVAWAERDVRRVEVPSTDVPRLSLTELQARVREKNSEARPASISLKNDPGAAVVFSVGRDGAFYVNPYTGEVRSPATTRTHDFMHVMEDWHRVLAMKGENRALGKAITGACNAAFLGLAMTGLYIWWPRKWGWRLVKPSLWFVKAKGKYRDWNWHNVIGFWSLPVLIILTASGMVISYRWASNLVYTAVGEAPPAQGRQGAAPAAPIAKPSPEARPLAFDELIAAAQKQVPNWDSISLRTGSAAPRGPGAGAPPGGAPGPNTGVAPTGAAVTAPTARAERPLTAPVTGEAPARRQGAGNEGRGGAAGAQPVTVSIKATDQWPIFSSTTLSLNPYTGEVLKTETYADGTSGRKARSWLRFLHTGQALGTIGQLVAGLACFGGCVLVYTGFALSYRRFFGKKKPAARA